MQAYSAMNVFTLYLTNIFPLYYGSFPPRFLLKAESQICIMTAADLQYCSVCCCCIIHPHYKVSSKETKY